MFAILPKWALIVLNFCGNNSTFDTTKYICQQQYLTIRNCVQENLLRSNAGCLINTNFNNWKPEEKIEEIIKTIYLNMEEFTDGKIKINEINNTLSVKSDDIEGDYRIGLPDEIENLIQYAMYKISSKISVEECNKKITYTYLNNSHHSDEAAHFFFCQKWRQEQPFLRCFCMGVMKKHNEKIKDN